MKKGNNFLSFLFALVAIGGAVVAVCAYLKSKEPQKRNPGRFSLRIWVMSSTIAGAIAVKRIIAVMRPMLRRILKKNPWKNSFWVKTGGISLLFFCCGKIGV